MEKGREEGMEKGMEKGREEEKIQTVIKGLKKGYSIEIISELTGLSKQQIDEINQPQPLKKGL